MNNYFHARKVARETVLKFNPNLNIVARHADIFNDTFDLDYFEQFDLVMNALDNLSASTHLNWSIHDFT